MYPISHAEGRNFIMRLACNRAVDVAMRRLHDMPAMTSHLAYQTGASADIVRQVFAERFHERMKTDPSNCRWCGLAQREALAELEAEA